MYKKGYLLILNCVSLFQLAAHYEVHQWPVWSLPAGGNQYRQEEEDPRLQGALLHILHSSHRPLVRYCIKETHILVAKCPTFCSSSHQFLPQPHRWIRPSGTVSLDLLSLHRFLTVSFSRSAFSSLSLWWPHVEVILSSEALKYHLKSQISGRNWTLQFSQLRAAVKQLSGCGQWLFLNRTNGGADDDEAYLSAMTHMTWAQDHLPNPNLASSS